MIIKALEIMVFLHYLSPVRGSYIGRNGLKLPASLVRRTPTNLSANALDHSSLQPTSLSKSVLDPLVICGPSGVGKGTIIAKFMEELGGSQKFGFSVSHTTRQPRPGEVDGVHYHFTSTEAMREDITHGNKFLEYAEVHGNLYGTSWETLRSVQATGKKCLLDIDVQGVQRLKMLHSREFRPKYIFVAPPSLETLLERLQSRATETPESLAKRTANAKAELEYGTAEGNFDCIIVNDDLGTACQDLKKAVESLYDQSGTE